MNKIINLDQVKNIPSNQKKVLVGGVFDLIHYGHIKFLTEAKSQGDTLIVALESDINVKQKKGEGRPIHPQKVRAEMLSALSSVDYVLALPEMKNDQDYFDLVKAIKPAVIAVTSNDPQLENKRKQIESIKGELAIVTDYIPTPSTSSITKLFKVE